MASFWGIWLTVDSGQLTCWRHEGRLTVSCTLKYTILEENHSLWVLQCQQTSLRVKLGTLQNIQCTLQNIPGTLRWLPCTWQSFKCTWEHFKCTWQSFKCIWESLQCTWQPFTDTFEIGQGILQNIPDTLQHVQDTLQSISGDQTINECKPRHSPAGLQGTIDHSEHLLDLLLHCLLYPPVALLITLNGGG
jgi:hypothetical protein